jgi:signal transduction histidine kinase
VKLNDRVYRLLPLPIRGLSLRTIVIVSALSVVVVVITIGTWVWVGVKDEQYSELDRRLDSLSNLGDIGGLLSNAPHANTDQPISDVSLVRTVRVGGTTVSVPSDVILPQFDNGYANAAINGVEYRVHTLAAGGASIALGAPVAEAQRQIDAQHLRVLCICGGVIVGTVLVGWVMWLIMIYPFRLLAQQARAINAQSNPDEVQVRGVWEAVEIAEAVEGMLARTKAALESARDFAAVASHELRTPLTAVRTNLEVLSTLDMTDEQRNEVIGDVMRTQTRIEETLTALERLAQGQLTTADDHVPLDIAELLDRAAHDAQRSYPDVEVSLVPSPTVLILGLPAGLRAGGRQRDRQRRQAWRCHRNSAQRSQFRRGCGNRGRRQRHRCARGGARRGLRTVLPRIDRLTLWVRPRARVGRSAGRVTQRRSVAGIQPVGRHATHAATARTAAGASVPRRGRGGGVKTLPAGAECGRFRPNC